MTHSCMRDAERMAVWRSFSPFWRVLSAPSSRFWCRLAQDDSQGGEEEASRRRAIMATPATTPEERGEHRLQFAYSLWFSKRAPGNKPNNQRYDQNLKLVCTFDTVEQFWRHYSHLIRPSEMSGHSDYHLFKEGIKPMWEDEANRTGGKWIVRLRKGLASRCWENLILAILGEQFMVGEEVCGAVVSVRFQEDIVSIWNRTASDSQTTLRIRDTLRRVLNLPVNTVMEYKTHTDSLRDNSSFRNTDIFLR
uniref:eIF-4F 25 kDa subunit n=1 Tax=Amblyomma maculatum TaxID=34609 RepID=G3MSR1_AMBMU